MHSPAPNKNETAGNKTGPGSSWLDLTESDRYQVGRKATEEFLGTKALTLRSRVVRNSQGKGGASCLSRGTKHIQGNSLVAMATGINNREGRNLRELEF